MWDNPTRQPDNEQREPDTLYTQRGTHMEQTDITTGEEKLNMLNTRQKTVKIKSETH